MTDNFEFSLRLLRQLPESEWEVLKNEIYKSGDTTGYITLAQEILEKVENINLKEVISEAKWKYPGGKVLGRIKYLKKYLKDVISGKQFQPGDSPSLTTVLWRYFDHKYNASEFSYLSYSSLRSLHELNVYKEFIPDFIAILEDVWEHPISYGPEIIKNEFGNQFFVLSESEKSSIHDEAKRFLNLIPEKDQYFLNFFKDVIYLSGRPGILCINI